MQEAELREFRNLYETLFKNRDSVEETPELLAEPLYPRYKQLAPKFYNMMLKARKERGLR